MPKLDEPPEFPPSWWRLSVAAAVHIFTASGIVCALLALLAVFDRAWELCFVWLGVALLIDGLDGTFARLVDIERRLPRFSGERLDQVIDYVTYVLIPVLALLQAGYLSGGGGLVLASAILLSSLFHFADIGNKSEDHCFVGFPAIWNIVAFYVFALSLPPWAVTLAILICVALTFVPMRWVHPLRVVALWRLTGVLTFLWAVAAAWTVWRGFPAHPVGQAVLIAIGAYGVGLSLVWPWLTARRS